MLSWIVCSTHQVLARFAQLPEYREYLSQSLSAFARKSEKNCRRSEQVGMRILEDRSAPQGKNIWTAVNCHSMSFVQATTFWLLTYLKLQKACSITTAWHQTQWQTQGRLRLSSDADSTESGGAWSYRPTLLSTDLSSFIIYQYLSCGTLYRSLLARPWRSVLKLPTEAKATAATWPAMRAAGEQCLFGQNTICGP